MSNVLAKCWHEPYLAVETLQAALQLFSTWATTTSDETRDGTKWMLSPLSACLDEVVTLVTSHLGILIEVASSASSEGREGRGIVGHDARVLLDALKAVYMYIPDTRLEDNACVPSPSFRSHPGVIELRARCIRFLLQLPGSSLPPTAHLLTVASLETILRGEVGRVPSGDSCGSNADRKSVV